MGFFDEDYSVQLWEARVKGAQDKVAAEKRNREQAKACGNYKNASKGTRLRNGKLGNCYDVNVQAAEIGLQYAKECLARAKEKAREAKKRKQEEAKRTAAASKASSSSSSRSSRSSSTSTVVKSSVVGAAVATSLSKSSSSNSEPTTYSHSESSYSTGGTVSSNNISGSYERSKPAKRSRNGLVTLILCIFFGVFGVHRFYVGKTGTGILQFFTAGGYFIWTFVDLVHILTGKFTDSEGNVIRVFN